jgi:hypothetical protein
MNLTATLVLLTMGGGIVQDRSPVLTYPTMDKCLEAMNERFEDFTEEIEEGLYTFQCDQSE